MRVIAGAGLCVLLGCDPEGGDAQSAICDEANAEVEACFGVQVESPLVGCGPEEQQLAEEILAGIEQSGCDGVPAGKDDSFLCSALLWDPFGWCDEPPPPLGPEPQGEPTEFPIILAHGFNTSTTNFWRFNDVDVALEKDGHVVALGSVPPFDTPQVRASFLADQVDELLARTGADKVNMVCFSAGGVDCRFLASPQGLAYGDKIASVTTISSPHRGTAIADVGAGLLPSEDRGKAIDALATMYGKTFSEVAEDSHLIAALQAMSTQGMVEFNDTIFDAPGVFYQSWAGVSSVGGFAHPVPGREEDACRDAQGKVRMLRHEGTHDAMDKLLVANAPFVAGGLKLEPNDGLATVQSAKWGLFRGCIPADHLDQVGQVDDEPGDHRTGFDYIRFYRNIAYDLAARGF